MGRSVLWYASSRHRHDRVREGGKAAWWFKARAVARGKLTTMGGTYIFMRELDGSLFASLSGPGATMGSLSTEAHEHHVLARLNAARQP